MNPDQAIDRVLTGLATTETSPDMEQRLLSAVQTRIVAPRRTSSNLALLFPLESRHPERGAQREVEGPRGSLRHPYLSNLSATAFRPWAIAAGIIILSLAASLAVRRRHEPTHDAAVLKQHAPQPTAPTPLLTEAQPESNPHRAVVSATRFEPNTAAPEDINDLDAMAVIEMNAPSKPAPPLPLTHQERLLADAVDQVGPEKLSSLRPEVMAQQMELSRAEFHNFFYPPPTKDNE